MWNLATYDVNSIKNEDRKSFQLRKFQSIFQSYCLVLKIDRTMVVSHTEEVWGHWFQLSVLGGALSALSRSMAALWWRLRGKTSLSSVNIRL